MSSYISNSKKTFPIRVTFVFILFSAAYHFMLPKTAANKLRPQNQNQDTKLKIETLLTTDSQSKVILVGSSLTARVDEAYLSSHFLNLGMGGRTSIDGLHALNSLSINPEAIMVELNVVRPPNSELDTTLNRLKHTGLLFAESNQPITRLLTFLKSKQPAPIEYNAEIFNIGITEELKRNSAEKCMSEIENRNLIEHFHEKVNEFKAQGTKLLFFRVPIDPRLDSSACFKQHWQLVHEIFREPIFTVEDTKYQTTDGLHLSASSAKMFANELKDYFLKEAKKW